MLCDTESACKCPQGAFLCSAAGWVQDHGLSHRAAGMDPGNTSALPCKTPHIPAGPAWLDSVLRLLSAQCKYRGASRSSDSQLYLARGHMPLKNSLLLSWQVHRAQGVPPQPRSPNLHSYCMSRDVTGSNVESERTGCDPTCTY